MADLIASENWNRYLEMKARGHHEFTNRAKRNLGFYLGDGRQWDAQTIELLESKGLPYFEYNQIKAGVDASVGYQIHNRADVSFRPKGGEADMRKAEVISKLIMDIFGRNDYHDKETDLFRDGMITGRAFLDVRVSFDKNRKGEIVIDLLDPADVIPDPDAKSYDPDDWDDVIVTRWMTREDIELKYTKKIADMVSDMHPYGDADFGAGDFEADRAKFGTEGESGMGQSWASQQNGIRRYRIIDRQRRVNKREKCVVMDAGDFRPVDQLSDEKLAEMIRQGGSIMPMTVKKIKWTVSTQEVVLFDEWSPLTHFSVVMFSPYFVRGLSVGMVDNAIGPQQTLNKMMSNLVAISGQTANSGYYIEQDSLVNMDEMELEHRGAQNGVVIVHKAGKRPEKINPNSIPTGIDNIIQRCIQAIRDVTVPEAMTGMQGQEISGVAIQSRQFAAQQTLATPLNNLTRTRRIMARNVLDFVQKHYSGERIIRITEIDPNNGQKMEETVKVNTYDPLSGGIMNDITNGEYDVEVSDQPAQITYDNSQFTQAMELFEKGIPIPPKAMIRHSNLVDKYDIIREMDATPQAPQDPSLQSKANLMDEQAKKVASETAQIKASTVYALTQTAMGLSTNVALVPAIDELGKSIGFQDMNGGGIADGPIAAAPLSNDGINGIPNNPHTNPITPEPAVSPMTGMQQGIETLPNNL